MGFQNKKAISLPEQSDLKHETAPAVKQTKEMFEMERLSRLLFTPLEQAVQEVTERRSNQELVDKIDAYLNDDVPSYFKRDTPVFYLQRFIATPNQELLHAAEITKPYPLPLIVGQDFKSKFNTSNELKLPLGKLPVVKGLSHNKDEIIEYFTMIDFNEYNGKPLNEIKTRFNTSLIDFHHSLLSEISLPKVTFVNETDWIDRNHRDDIYKQYKKVWALLCVYGIMLESYVPSDYAFFNKVIYPSFKEVEAELGVTPLVVEHISPDREHERNWNSYPSFFYQFIKRQFKL